MVFGTRPEIIKLGPVYQELMRKDIDTDVFWSGQHLEMADGLFELFDIKVKYQTYLENYSCSISEKTSEILHHLSEIVSNTYYDWIIVQGDTITALAGAMCGFLNKIPVAHVEAGLRTYDHHSPYPEEYNRQIITLSSSIHFAPTSSSVRNLMSEGIHSEDIIRTGNTVIDAIRFAMTVVGDRYTPHDPDLLRIDPSKKLILATMHRRENIGDKMEIVLNSIATLSDDGDKQILLPVHMNPEVSEMVHKILDGKQNVLLVNPLVYTDLIYVLKKAWTVISDSGGLQEEVPSFQIHMLITRDTTERPEVVETGFGFLVDSDYNMIVNKVRELTDQDHKVRVYRDNPFGDGNSAMRIANALVSRITNDERTKCNES
jgi:UDP-N-acetylglucosamine 2-epimerase